MMVLTDGATPEDTSQREADTARSASECWPPVRNSDGADVRAVGGDLAASRLAAGVRREDLLEESRVAAADGRELCTLCLECLAWRRSRTSDTMSSSKPALGV
jgi:hypothetical protein